MGTSRRSVGRPVRSGCVETPWAQDIGCLPEPSTPCTNYSTLHPIAFGTLLLTQFQLARDRCQLTNCLRKTPRFSHLLIWHTHELNASLSFLSHTACLCVSRVTELLGSGQFGQVNRGVWQNPASEEIEVAVKTLKKGVTEEDKVRFLQEAAISGQFQHPNVVRLQGVVTVGEPVSLDL